MKYTCTKSQVQIQLHFGEKKEDKFQVNIVMLLFT